jgi:hypothetical protein
VIDKRGCARFGIDATNLYATALAEGRPDEAFRVLNNALALAVLSGTVLAISIFFLAPYALVAFTGSSASVVLVGPSVCGNSGSGNGRGNHDHGYPGSLFRGQRCYHSITRCTSERHNQSSRGFGAGSTSAMPYCSSCREHCCFTVDGSLLYVVTSGKTTTQAAAADWGTTVARAGGRGVFHSRVPEFSALREFVMFAGPGFFALLGKVICYSSMTTAAAAAGTLSLAAHQVVIQVFFFFCNIGDTMSNTAQAFLPGLMSKGDLKFTRQVITTLVFVGSLIGLVDATLAGASVACMGHIFTTSAPVLELMRSLVGYLAISLVLHANVVALEGVLFSARQAQYLALAYAASTTAVFSVACHSVCLSLSLCLCLCAVLPLPLCLCLSLDSAIYCLRRSTSASVSSSYTYW